MLQGYLNYPIGSDDYYPFVTFKYVFALDEVVFFASFKWAKHSDDTSEADGVVPVQRT